MNQLELLSDYKKQVVRDRIADANAVFLGDVYIYLNQSSYTIRTVDPFDSLKFMASEPISFVMTKEYVIDYVRSHFFGGSKVSIAGFDNIYIDGKSDLTAKTLTVFHDLRSLFECMQLEYEEFVDYLNHHLDEIILNGGIY